MKTYEDLKKDIIKSLSGQFEKRNVYGRQETMLCCLESEIPNMAEDILKIVREFNAKELIGFYYSFEEDEVNVCNNKYCLSSIEGHCIHNRSEVCDDRKI